MNVPQRVIMAVLVLVAFAALLNLPRWGRQYRIPEAWDGRPRFSTPSAWEDARTLATRFPRRWSGSPDRRAAADWLVVTLDGIGLAVTRETFSAALGQAAPVTLENVWGQSVGRERPQEVVLVLGNYDMAPTSFQAASDTAAHVGTVLELARVIHASRPRRTFVFLFPDGEEWGMLGARHFARTFDRRSQVVASVTVEDLNVGNFRALRVEGTGQFQGFAPMWLRALAAHAAWLEHYPAHDHAALQEWTRRSVLVSATDQGPLVAVGIPSIKMSGIGDDPCLDNRVYHLPGDTIENIVPDSVGTYGRIVERVLRAIDAMEGVPRESSFYLRLGHDRIVPGGHLLLAQVSTFLPLLAALLIHARRGHLTRPTLLREAVETGGILALLLVGLLTAKALRDVGLLPDYELYPPPPRHPLLTDVDWGAVGVIFLVVLAAAWLGRLLKAPLIKSLGIACDTVRSPASPPEILGPSLLWLLLVVAVTLVDNPFGAVTFLLLPATFWIWIEPALSRTRRLANALLVGAGFLVLPFLLYEYNRFLQIGPYIVWYLFLGATYGQLTLLRVILTLATVAIAVRLLVAAPLSQSAPR